MAIELSDLALQSIATFEAETGARANDCLLEEATDTLVFVVHPEDMAAAIGPGGETVERLESMFDRRVILVENAEIPEEFVANALAPAAVYDVIISRDGETATAVVDPDDMGVAVGRNGERIDRARRLANRHYSITEIELEADE